MTNQDIQTALAYHEGTKLSYINLRNKPPLYKSYPGLPVVPLPTDFPALEAPTLDSVATVGSTTSLNPLLVRRDTERPLDLATLAQLLFFSAGLVRRGVLTAAGEVHYRAASSAGALYPIEVYLVCEDIPGLEAGVYHFSPEDFTLTQLHRGDYRSELSRAAGSHQAVFSSPVTFIFTAIFWRSAWKYRARSYRYCLWDSGTILANLLATASASALPAQLLAGFVDSSVNLLLGIQEEREAALCLVPVGRESSSDSPWRRGGTSDPQGISPFIDRFPPSPGDEGPRQSSPIQPDGAIDYPEIRRLHTSAALHAEDEVLEWRGVMVSRSPQSQGRFYPLQPHVLGVSLQMSRQLGEVIRGRGSTRRFARDSISLSQFNSILDCSTRGVSADFLRSARASLLDIYIIVNAVEDFPAGSYFFSPQHRGLELLRRGAFREEAGHLCFEQALGADASVVVFFMADLERVLDRYGNRGYRATQLEAGILGGKMYLCTHSLGLGASGITFYDDDVAEFFSPHAAGKSTMFVVTLGVPAQKNRVRPFRSRVAARLDALARGAAKKEDKAALIDGSS